MDSLPPQLNLLIGTVRTLLLLGYLSLQVAAQIGSLAVAVFRPLLRRVGYNLLDSIRTMPASHSHLPLTIKDLTHGE
ncbi:putative transmembrane protein [Solenopsis invicta virus 2]|uniref:Putative transmembrane protein n=1 Tax=Solenopsis invicta virus 2 TaxID=439491 RepID=A0A220QTG7_9VIRU|nr:putative transmembrane protein [Solenopsis invicta virus 2]ASK12214.1 putative transmembrane protein [Solenopsis invicta virus 2]AXL96892.1 putative transmembrane protein [Solenopsis invicta virus 2]